MGLSAHLTLLCVYCCVCVCASDLYFQPPEDTSVPVAER